MATFIVRVELRGADSEDYENLHEKMAASGYSREIQDTSGTWFHLPTAEYTAMKGSTSHGVREQVRTIAGSVKPDYYILVSEASDISWYLAKK